MTASYAYNASGQRIEKKLHNVGPDREATRVTHFAYTPDGWLLSEIGRRDDKSKTFTDEYIWLGGQPLAKLSRKIKANGETARAEIIYLHTDHLATPRSATNENGDVVWTWDGDAFGAQRADRDPDGDGKKTKLRLRFPGQYFDDESGLHYNHHRDYDPRLGRYIQSDPIGLWGGHNRYGYVKANPLKWIDPQGLDLEIPVWLGSRIPSTTSRSNYTTSYSTDFSGGGGSAGGSGGGSGGGIATHTGGSCIGTQCVTTGIFTANTFGNWSGFSSNYVTNNYGGYDYTPDSWVQVAGLDEVACGIVDFARGLSRRLVHRIIIPSATSVSDEDMQEFNTALELSNSIRAFAINNPNLIAPEAFDYLIENPYRSFGRWSGAGTLGFASAYYTRGLYAVNGLGGARITGTTAAA